MLKALILLFMINIGTVTIIWGISYLLFGSKFDHDFYITILSAKVSLISPICVLLFFSRSFAFLMVKSL